AAACSGRDAALEHVVGQHVFAAVRDDQLRRSLRAAHPAAVLLVRQVLQYVVDAAGDAAAGGARAGAGDRAPDAHDRRACVLDVVEYGLDLAPDFLRDPLDLAPRR